MKMCRKFLAVALAFMLLVSVFPMSANAATVDAQDVTSLVTAAKGAIGKTREQLKLPDNHWCGYFTGYCINNSRLTKSLGKISNAQCAYAIDIADWVCNIKQAGTFYVFSSAHQKQVKQFYPDLKKPGRLIKTTSSSFTPKVGDFVEFTWHDWGEHEFDHVGIVSKVTNKYITYIEGNTSAGGGYEGTVVSQSRRRDDSSIIGYVRINTGSSEPSSETDQSTSSTYSAGNYAVDHVNGVNVRSGAGTSYLVVGAAANKTTFSVSKISGEWGYTSSINTGSGYQSGWVNLAYCKKGSVAPQIADSNSPNVITLGRSFSIKGTISSASKLKSVTAGVYTSTSGGSMKIGKTVNPNVTSFSLSNLDADVKFGKLPAGVYYYRVSATNDSGTTTLLNKRFTVVLPSGWFTLSPKNAPKTSLDVKGAATTNEANVQIYRSNKSSAQQWKFMHLGNGWYTITARCSGKALDVKGGVGKFGTNVQQYAGNGTAAQKWYLQDSGDGYYYLLPQVNASLALDVYDGRSANGTNVWVYTQNGTNAQKWKLQKV